MMLQSITTEIMRNDNFFTDNQNLWRKSRFHELGIRRMPRFFVLICTLVTVLRSSAVTIGTTVSGQLGPKPTRPNTNLAQN